MARSTSGDGATTSASTPRSSTASGKPDQSTRVPLSLALQKCLATLLLEMKSSQKSQQLKTSTGLQELEPGMRYSPGLGADVACSSSGGSGRVFCSRRCLVLRRIDSEYIVEVEQCNRLRPFKCTADHDSGGGFSRYTGYHGLGLGFLDAHRACEAAGLWLPACVGRGRQFMQRDELGTRHSWCDAFLVASNTHNSLYIAVSVNGNYTAFPQVSPYVLPPVCCSHFGS